MRIEKIYNIKNITYIQKNNVPSINSRYSDLNLSMSLSGPEIPFKANLGIQTHNLLNKKMQLLKKITEMLNYREKYTENAVFVENREKISKYMTKYVSRAIIREFSKGELSDIVSIAVDDANYINNFIKDFITEHMDDFQPMFKKIIDENQAIINQRASADSGTNYELLNRLHSTVITDDFNLSEVYKNYYSKLNTISTIEELQQKGVIDEETKNLKLAKHDSYTNIG